MRPTWYGTASMPFSKSHLPVRIAVSGASVVLKDKRFRRHRIPVPMRSLSAVHYGAISRDQLTDGHREASGISVMTAQQIKQRAYGAVIFG